MICSLDNAYGTGLLQNLLLKKPQPKNMFSWSLVCEKWSGCSDLNDGCLRISAQHPHTRIF